MKKIFFILTIGFLVSRQAGKAQVHSNDNLWYNNGAEAYIGAGCLVTVQGDMTNNQAGVTGITHINNNGFVWLQGNAYGDNAVKQTGTGTLRLQNKTGLYVAPYATENYQVIQGGYRVNGGQSAIAASDDGSIYNLELDNQNGLVFIKNNTDVRGSVDFKPVSVTVDGVTIAPNGSTNRILTYDPGTAASPATAPANGSSYTAVFGMMNNAAGLANFKNVSTNLLANTATLDNAYIQGKLRRAIEAVAGGAYGFPMGLEPSVSTTAARGIQYNSIDFVANTYDVLTGYFQQGSSNAGATGQAAGCGSAFCTYGGRHGEWSFNSLIAGGETYTMTIYPQDYAEVCNAGGQLAITKNDAFSGSGCGVTPLGLTRTGMSGFSDFGFASTSFILPVTLTAFDASLSNCNVTLKWKSGTEANFKQYNVQHSIDGSVFTTIGNLKGKGDGQTYSYLHTAASQKNWYRLLAVDLDGKSDFSKIIFVSTNCNQRTYRLIPNVISAVGQCQLLLTGYGSEVSGILYNSVGQQLKTLQLKNGNNNISLSNLSAGMYIFKITDAIDKSSNSLHVVIQ